jgi:hypothetical protein
MHECAVLFYRTQAALGALKQKRLPASWSAQRLGKARFELNQVFGNKGRGGLRADGLAVRRKEPALIIAALVLV